MVSAMGCCAILNAETAPALGGLEPAAAWLQLSGALCGRRGGGGGGLERRCRGRCARRRRRSGAAAVPCARGQCADARWRRRRHAERHLDLGAGAAHGSRSPTPWRRAGSRRWRRWCAMPRQPEAGGRTPSDLPLLALSQAEIERLENRYPRIEDILPLSPLQEGLLFHALYDAQGPDVYTVQLLLELDGPLHAGDARGGGAGVAGTPRQPARRLPAREPEPAGADRCVVCRTAVAEHRPVGAGRCGRSSSG